MYALRDYLNAINQTKEPLLDTEDEDWEFKFYKDPKRHIYQLNTLEQVMAVSPLQYTNEVV